MNERNHVDIFTGLGGFSLAAQANGVRTIAMCECDPRCQAFLAKAWPGVPVWTDVRTFSLADATRGQHSEHTDREWQSRQGRSEPVAGNSGRMANTIKGDFLQPQAGRQRGAGIDAGGTTQVVWLLTAGVPCQPASRAGKQRGKEDDRWLWPAALSVFAAIRPAWAIFENPPGLQDLFEYGVQLGVDGDGNSTEPVGTVVERDGHSILCETLDAIKAQGYAVKPLGIPACAVGAPHRRMRFWIVCKRVGMAHTPERGQREHGGASGHAGHADECGQGLDNSAVTRSYRPQQSSEGEARDKAWLRLSGAGRENHWSNYVWLPCADGKVRRAPSDTQRMAHGLPVELLEGLASDIEAQLEKGDHFTPHRSLLGALGNSIVWPVAAKIIEAMILSENESE